MLCVCDTHTPVVCVCVCVFVCIRSPCDMITEKSPTIEAKETYYTGTAHVLGPKQIIKKMIEKNERGIWLGAAPVFPALYCVCVCVCVCVYSLSLSLSLSLSHTHTHTHTYNQNT